MPEIKKVKLTKEQQYAFKKFVSQLRAGNLTLPFFKKKAEEAK